MAVFNLGSLALCGASIAVLLPLISKLSAPFPPRRSKRLGDPTYDLEKIDAPAATGAKLRIVAWALADSPVAPLLRRFLINQNGADELQDLALQVVDEGKSTVAYTPMHRLTTEEWKRHEAAASGAGSVKTFLQEGFDAQPPAPGVYVTVEDYAKAYKSGAWTPTSAMERLLQAIRKLPNEYRVFVTVREEDVRKQAQESERRILKGEARSIFEGVPIAVKDMVSVRGHPFSEGTVWPAGDRHNKWAEEDDNTVRLFREAGAIILGTTVMTEFGVTPLGYSVHFKGPVNAYNGSYYCGGSSGSAVAVALGLVPVAVGMDGGGSIRIPAAMEGAVGLAPTYGRVPDSSPDTLFGTMVKTGPIAATTRDAALAHAVMSQSVSSHIFTRLYGEPFGVPPVHLEGFTDLNLKGIRLGVFWDHFNDAEPLVVEACKAALESLKALGAEVVPVALPHLKALSLAHGLDISVEFSTFFGNLLYNGHNLEPGTRIQLGLGYTISGVEFNSANILRGWALKYMHEEVFTKLNVQAIVSPSMGILPPKMPEDVTSAGESNTPLIMQMMKYIFLGNLLGLPGISVPVGYDDNTKLPVSMHLMGAHWEEAVLLRLANALETRHLQRKKPSAFFDLRAEL